MKRYIDADKLIKELSNTQKTWGKRLGTSWWSHSVKLKDNMIRCINEQPLADVEEVKHGEWKEFYDEGYKCSSCGTLFITHFAIEKSNYCPKCGAKMDGEKKQF